MLGMNTLKTRGVVALAALLFVTACGTDKTDVKSLPALPSAASVADVPSPAVTEPTAEALPVAGPGTFRGFLYNTNDEPVTVRVVVAADTTAAPNADAQRVASFRDMSRKADSSSVKSTPLHFVVVEVDNVGKTSSVGIPEINVLGSDGVGATFEPAFKFASELGEKFEPMHPVYEAGVSLYNDLLVELFEVRPGKLERILYVSQDPLVGVGTVLVSETITEKIS